MGDDRASSVRSGLYKQRYVWQLSLDPSMCVMMHRVGTNVAVVGGDELRC